MQYKEVTIGVKKYLRVQITAFDFPLWGLREGRILLLKSIALAIIYFG